MQAFEVFIRGKGKRNMENTYHCYANRELSWLRFNERVLEEAEDSRLPLCCLLYTSDAADDLRV